MSKHTRGPWRYIWPNCEGGSFRIDSPVDTRPVAYVDNGRRADALLITAAPEMLATLKECAAEIDDFIGADVQRGERQKYIDAEREFLARVHTVIAKATGEETEW